MQTTERIAGAARHDRRVVGEPGDPCETGDLLHRLGEPGPITPHALEAPRGHAHDHEAGVGVAHGVVDEAETVHDTRHVVLDQDVARGEQAPADRDALVAREVDRDVALAGVGRVEERRELPRPVAH